MGHSHVPEKGVVSERKMEPDAFLNMNESNPELVDSESAGPIDLTPIRRKKKHLRW